MGEETVPGMESDNEPTPDGDGAEPTPDAGEEAADDAGDAGKGEGDQTPAPSDEPPAYVKDLQDRLEKAEKALAVKATDQPTPKDQGSPTPEFFEQMKKDLGLSKTKDESGQEITSLNPDQLTKGLLNFGREILAAAKAHAESMVHGSTSEIRTDAILSELSVKTPDIRRYTPQIKEYIKARYQPKDFSNPTFIMDGYYWAKGKGGPAPAANGDRSKVRVITPSRVTPGNKTGSAKPLGTIERSMIGKEFRDEKELRAFRDADLSKL